MNYLEKQNNKVYILGEILTKAKFSQSEELSNQMVGANQKPLF